MNCPICGKPIANYTAGDFFPWQCLGHHYPPIPVTPQYGFNGGATNKECEHCFCIDDNINAAKPHLKCCMCGTRKLKGGVSL